MAEAAAAQVVRQIRLTFDPNLTREIMPSITSIVMDRQVKGLPEELVRDYAVTLTLGDETVLSEKSAITGSGSM